MGRTFHKIDIYRLKQRKLCNRCTTLGIAVLLSNLVTCHLFLCAHPNVDCKAKISKTKRAFWLRLKSRAPFKKHVKDHLEWMEMHLDSTGFHNCIGQFLQGTACTEFTTINKHIHQLCEAALRIDLSKLISALLSALKISTAWIFKH